MTEDQFQAFLRESIDYLKARNEELRENLGVGTYPRFDWDLETAELVFGEGELVKVIARIQYVGTFSARHQTFIWGWANPSIHEASRQLMDKIKLFGEQARLAALAVPRFDAREADGWAMTALSARILSAKGGYRVPSEDLTHYFVFTEIGPAAGQDGKPTTGTASGKKRGWLNWLWGGR